ncbi:MAG: TonB-dependent receptor [Prolixibacteraceae bacterium]|nr:TonB-dependent receptor [Prolixibacteraceae bacterium]MBN2648969.1 TonB-dependent receptor [Prolixibacteraceae bacterium]
MKTQFFKNLIFTALVVLSVNQLNAQTFTQVVRGTVIDADTKAPIPGANIVIAKSNPFVGTVSDIDGIFRLENITPGRITLYVTCVGYEKLTVPNLAVISGKESFLELEMTQSFEMLKEVTVKNGNGKGNEVLNEMAIVSARAFTVDETKRYAGSLDDPSRMVSAFAGVTSDASGINEIIVRGNSPKGVQWRLEGVEIPNPNHFSHQGNTGGPINALSSNMLGTSDFYTGAFAPEYGNVLSGIFDMKMRTGNNEKHEFTLGIGALGIDLAAEGPFKKGSRSSYNINYRYSTLSLIDQLNLVDFGGVPRYQDLSFKTNFITKKAGTFSFFGLGGYSEIDVNQLDKNEETVFRGTQISKFGVVGLNHLLLINQNSFLKTTVSASNNGSWFEAESRFSDKQFYESMKRDWDNNTLQFSTRYSNSINNNLRVVFGIEYKHMFYNMNDQLRYQNNFTWRTNIDMEENTGQFESFASIKYRIARNLNMVGGLHYTNFLLNNSQAIEPRIAVKWNTSPRSNFNIGYGKHSMPENIVTYFTQVYDDNMNASTPNKNLGLTKANHFIAGYEHRILKNINAKLELYYQNLYDVPVENLETSSFSVLNDAGNLTFVALVNEGKGRNYGAEFTLERYFNNSYYYLFTSSLYKSEYMTLTNEWYNTMFDGNYAFNFLIGKEFILGRPERGNTLNLNSKILFNGNRKYLPVDLEASRNLGSTVYDYSEPYTKRLDNIFQVNFTASLKLNRKHVTHEILLDFYNLLNNQASVSKYYNEYTETIETAKQLALMPNVMYRIHF